MAGANRITGKSNWVDRYQLDVEVAEHSEQLMKYRLIRNKADEVRRSLIKGCCLKTLTSRDKPRAQSSAHDDFVRPAGHGGFPSLVAIDSGRATSCVPGGAAV
jgi:hypothetical protein